jgi:hypothetical protein
MKKVQSRHFMALGYGINSYFDTLLSFVKLFALLTILNLGVLYAYNSYEGVKGLSGVSKSAVWSIGNLGASST